MWIAALGLVLSLLIGVTLGLLGGGGSVLTVPLLVYVFGLEPKPAIASSLLVVGVASLAAVLQHWRAGHVAPRTAALFGAAGMAGAYLGGRAGAFIDGVLLLLGFAGMMLLTAAAMWRGRRTVARAPSGRGATLRLVAQGFGVGLFAGLVGAGGGFLIVPALTLWGGLPMQTAVGTSLLVIVLQSAAGVVGYLAHVAIDLRLAAAVALAAVVGSLAGSRIARALDPTSLRRGFAALVGGMAVFILVREGETWLATARAALPSSIPQLIFVGLVLAIGIVAGRVSQRAPSDPLGDPYFSQGDGI